MSNVILKIRAFFNDVLQKFSGVQAFKCPVYMSSRENRCFPSKLYIKRFLYLSVKYEVCTVYRRLLNSYIIFMSLEFFQLSQLKNKYRNLYLAIRLRAGDIYGMLVDEGAWKLRARILIVLVESEIKIDF